jgi:uncharacterized protein YdhG (YjbR/CyaY superfamily)
MPNHADHRTPGRDARTAQPERAVQEYIEAITPEHRPLFDRLHRLILEAQPGATVVLSYQIPTYQFGGRRLHVGAWKHGVSLYGWQQGGDAGFTSRHPGLRTGRGTIRLRPEDAEGIADGEFRDLACAALGAADGCAAVSSEDSGIPAATDGVVSG